MKNYFILLSLSLLISGSIFAQKEKEVKIKVDGQKLYGTLTIVENKREAPVVIIIPGSGPTDRNGNSGLLQSNSYKYIAEALAEKNIASLRYDKLFIGESKAKNIKESDMTFQDNVDWVLGWIHYLTKKGYEDIILAGHSEGSLIGILAAQSGKVDQFISIAGAGRNIGDVLIEQINVQSPKLSKETATIIEALKKGDSIKEISPALQPLFRESVQPYIKSWLQYDPQIEIGKLDIPILIIQGEHDIQVSVEDAKLLKKGKKDATLTIIPNMNHILKDAPLERDKNMMTYYQPKLPLSKTLMPIIIKFIEQHY